MLKKILIGLVVLIAALAGYVGMQPDDFRIERSATVNAPAPDVFAQVNDFHKWEAWSPWAKRDPAAKATFEGPSAGQGATFKWSGNAEVGEGSMVVAESRPAELVRIDVEFVKPFEGRNTSEFAFAPQGNQTAVTWRMYGKHNFIGKAMCLVMNMEKMLGPDMEKGLAQMKSVAEGGKVGNKS
jgi:hypothetical protein